MTLQMYGSSRSQLTSAQPQAPLKVSVKLPAPQSSGASMLLGSGELLGWYIPQCLYAPARWSVQAAQVTRLG